MISAIEAYYAAGRGILLQDAANKRTLLRKLVTTFDWAHFEQLNLVITAARCKIFSLGNSTPDDDRLSPTVCRAVVSIHHVTSLGWDEWYQNHYNSPLHVQNKRLVQHGCLIVIEIIYYLDNSCVASLVFTAVYSTVCVLANRCENYAQTTKQMCQIALCIMKTCFKTVCLEDANNRFDVY